MKTMRRLVAALLVLTMVLALSGTAMAENKFKVGDYAKFTKNTHLYDGHHNHKITDTIVRKGSWAQVIDTFGSNWVLLRLNPVAVSETGAYVIPIIPYMAWVKTGDLKKISEDKALWNVIWVDEAGNAQLLAIADTHVVFSNKGNGYSEPWILYKDYSTPSINHVKATAKVWMRKTYALKKNYGRALHKDDVVKYRHQVGFDTRAVAFYGIRYKGEKLWVSSEYSRLVK